MKALYLALLFSALSFGAERPSSLETQPVFEALQEPTINNSCASELNHPAQAPGFLTDFIGFYRARSKDPTHMDGQKAQYQLLSSFLNDPRVQKSFDNYQVIEIYHILVGRGSPRFMQKAAALLARSKIPYVQKRLETFRANVLPEKAFEYIPVPEELTLEHIETLEGWESLKQIIGAGDQILVGHVMRRVFAFMAFNSKLGQIEKFYLAQNLIKAFNLGMVSTNPRDHIRQKAMPEPTTDGTLIICNEDCEFYFAITNAKDFYIGKWGTRLELFNPNEWESRAQRLIKAVPETW